jgi:hypothetical protein
MVIHKAICMDDKPVSCGNLLEDIQERLPVMIRSEHALLRIAARGYMIEGSRIFNTQLPCHNIPPRFILCLDITFKDEKLTKKAGKEGKLRTCYSGS